MTVERYSPVLRAWEWPEFGIDEPKSDMAVVTMPASWIPECQDDHFANASKLSALPCIFVIAYYLLFIV